MSRDYQSFLQSSCQSQWRRIGIRRRAGVLTPLFSLYSKNSIGAGEIPDLRMLADWCAATGLSLIQLLPMNDMGFNFRPYDAESSFALEPMYLSLEELVEVDLSEFKAEISLMRRAFGCHGLFFDVGIKKAKLDLLERIFLKRRKSGDEALNAFVEKSRFWLESYAQYKVLKIRWNQAGWMDWPREYRLRQPEAMARLESEEKEKILFQSWLQWQLAVQMHKAKDYAAGLGVLIMGDIPFLVSRDSADVWSNPSYFKLDLSSGAPPDYYFAQGQEWGMPPYYWGRIAGDNWRYLAEKLRYAENFYDLFRIDHFVGVFRVWTFRRGLPDEERRWTGAFDPPDESGWDRHGRRIMDAMIKSTGMLPCAEDLGCVPDCSASALEEYAIPGMEVQRWSRHWKTNRQFKSASEYRSNSIAVISTHDTSPLVSWWESEAGTEEDRDFFWKSIGLTGKPAANADKNFVKACLRTCHQADSIFSIQLLQDWLSLTDLLEHTGVDWRINKPGVLDEKNWRMRMPLSLEALLTLPANQEILRLNRESGRA